MDNGNLTTASDLQKEDENMESDSEKEPDSDSESDSNDPWVNLRVQVKGALGQGHVMEMNCFLEKGASEEAATAKAFNALLPVSRKRLRRLNLHY